MFLVSLDVVLEVGLKKEKRRLAEEKDDEQKDERILRASEFPSAFDKFVELDAENLLYFLALDFPIANETESFRIRRRNRR